MVGSRMETTRPRGTSHIVMMPSPGMGHLIPLAEFAKRLVLQHDFSVTFFCHSAGISSVEAQKTIADAIPKKANIIHLSQISLDDIPAEAKIETRMSLTIRRSLPQIYHHLKTLISKETVPAIIVDIFGTDVFDVANDLGVPPYLFFPSTAMALSLFLKLPQIDAETSVEYRDLNDPIQIPGCIPIWGIDLLDPVQDRKDDAYKWLLHHSKRYQMSKGIMENSFDDLEPGALKALKQTESLLPPVYSVGPLIRTGADDGIDGSSDCIKWLDQQPPGSVLYISFGSGGTLSLRQLTELALGLELSGHRFLWVVRSPNDKETNATFFSVASAEDPFAFLPNGFVERTQGLGYLIPSWASQTAILSHGSTGGFLSHCGWNSTLESITFGVPMIAWPLYAEQKMNAVLLTKDAQVALRPQSNPDGIIERKEIARIVKELMEGTEGKQVQNKAQKLKEAASAALSENGASTMAISNLVKIWNDHRKNL